MIQMLRKFIWGAKLHRFLKIRFSFYIVSAIRPDYQELHGIREMENEKESGIMHLHCSRKRTHGIVGK